MAQINKQSITAGPRPVQEPRPAPEGSPSGVFPKELEKRRAYLDVLRIHHLDLTNRFLVAGEGQVYEIDVVMAAAMARSYGLVDGFIAAFDSWNPVVAAPLLRMQVDSLIRLAYMAHAPRADAVAHHIFAGREFRTLKDDEGKTLTDCRLRKHAEDVHPWIGSVYQETSGWVHLSPAHLRAAWRLGPAKAGDGQGLVLSGSVPIRPEQIPLSELEQLLGAMIQATEQVFGYVEIWERRKGLPLGEIRGGESSP
jgi:hypothetical protein